MYIINGFIYSYYELIIVIYVIRKSYECLSIIAKFLGRKCSLLLKKARKPLKNCDRLTRKNRRFMPFAYTTIA